MLSKNSDFKLTSKFDKTHIPGPQKIDTVLGNYTILTTKTPTPPIMMITRLFTDRSDLLREIESLKKKSSLNNPNILCLLDYAVEVKKNWCANMYNLKLYFEVPMTSLRRDIVDRRSKTNKVHFSHKDITMLFYQMVFAGAHLQENGTSHCDINPNLVFGEKGTYKLAMKNSVVSNPYRHQYEKLMKSEPLYVSPLIYAAIKRSKVDQMKHDPYKSDVFSLGLMLAEAVILQSVQGIYTESDLIDSVKLQEVVFEVEKRQPGNLMFISALEKMLQIDEQKRPDFITLKKLLPDYQKIVNHFSQNQSQLSQDRTVTGFTDTNNNSRSMDTSNMTHNQTPVSVKKNQYPLSNLNSFEMGISTAKVRHIFDKKPPTSIGIYTDSKLQSKLISLYDNDTKKDQVNNGYNKSGSNRIQKVSALQNRDDKILTSEDLKKNNKFFEPIRFVDRSENKRLTTKEQEQQSSLLNDSRRVKSGHKSAWSNGKFMSVQNTPSDHYGLPSANLNPEIQDQDDFFGPSAYLRDSTKPLLFNFESPKSNEVAYPNEQARNTSIQSNQRLNAQEVRNLGKYPVHKIELHNSAYRNYGLERQSYAPNQGFSANGFKLAETLQGNQRRLSTNTFNEQPQEFFRTNTYDPELAVDDQNCKMRYVGSYHEGNNGVSGRTGQTNFFEEVNQKFANNYQMGQLNNTQNSAQNLKNNKQSVNSQHLIQLAIKMPIKEPQLDTKETSHGLLRFYKNNNFFGFK